MHNIPRTKDVFIVTRARSRLFNKQTMKMNKKIDKYDKAIEYAKANSNNQTEALIKEIRATYEINAVADAFIAESEKGDKEIDLKLNVEIKKVALKHQIRFAQMIVDNAEMIMERLDEINLEE